MRETKSMEDVIYEAIHKTERDPATALIMTKAVQDHISDYVARMPNEDFLSFAKTLIEQGLFLAITTPKKYTPDTVDKLKRALAEIQI